MEDYRGGGACLVSGSGALRGHTLRREVGDLRGNSGGSVGAVDGPQWASSEGSGLGVLLRRATLVR